MRCYVLIIAAAASLGLAACGSGGGGGGAAAPANGSAARPLGDRAVPGFVIIASQAGAATPGRTLGIQVRVVAIDGGTPAAVEAAVADANPLTWTPGSPSAAPGFWTWTLPAPDIPGRLWVRVTDGDGNTAETGLTDFLLLP